MRLVRCLCQLGFASWVLIVTGPGLIDAGFARAQSEDSQASAVPSVEPSKRAGPLESLLRLRGDRGADPITIESDELELRALADESRVLHFLRNVRVRHGDLELSADELEAFYPPQESEPSRLVARGDVLIDQPGQRAYCAEAEYLRKIDRLICRGDAKLVQGCDVVRGESIEFDLSADRARVIGTARVLIAPRGAAGDCSLEPDEAGKRP